jgi:hypothetical protein
MLLGGDSNMHVSEPHKSKIEPDRLVILSLAALAAICIGTLVALWWADTKPNTLGYELAKALLQLLVVAVVGTALSLATFNYQRSRDHRREIRQRGDELLRTLLNDALGSYHEIKRARRMLRARLWMAGGRESLRTEVYDEQLAAINDAQLDFERLGQLAGIVRDSRVDTSELVRCMDDVEKSVGRLVTEYERNRGTMAPEVAKASIDSLPELQRFIDQSDNRPFRQGIADPLRAFIAQLQKALLVPPETV